VVSAIEMTKSIGYALYQAQMGFKAPTTKPLRGFGGAGVLEVVEDYQTDTYRAVYTLKFADSVYVLHAFQKKSKKGRATPKRDIDLIKRRLKAAEEQYKSCSDRK
jgi:phage-related protein